MAEGQATKGSSGGGGGRTNFLIGYRAGRSHRGEQGAPQSPAHAPPPAGPWRHLPPHLVGAPVVQGNGGEAEDDPRPGNVSSGSISENMEGVRTWYEALHGGSPVPFPGDGRPGLRVPAL